MAETILEVKDLTKVYGTRYAVNNINFSIKKGEIFGFLGANGAGKSTTIKMITGLAKITSGDVFIDGKSISYDFEEAISNVGALVETPYFFPYLSAYNNLKYFGKLSGIKDINTRIMEVASLVGLENRIKDKVGSYSLGMKQRLGVAQALLHIPKVLILDEPTNGLDVNGIREFRIMLKNLAGRYGISILISSHILGEMENLCDTIGIIDKGSIIEVKPIHEIKTDLNGLNGSLYIKCNAPNYAGKIVNDKFGGKVKICGNKIMFNANEKILSKIIVELTKNKIMVYGAGEVDHSLEEVFLSVVNHGKSSTDID